MTLELNRPPGRPDLSPDCERCCGLCCVAPGFAASSDFAIDKKAGSPCPNLTEDFRCRIHHRLRAAGFTGCVAYDCFGAGQKVTQLTFGGGNWRDSPAIRDRMFEVYGVVRRLHGMLVYLDEALRLQAAGPVHDELRRAFEEIELISRGGPGELVALDSAPLQARVDDLLDRVSEAVRAQA